MKIKLTPYPLEEIPRNEWNIEVEFMHGDADKFETVLYSLSSKEFFQKVYQFFTKFTGEYDTFAVELKDLQNELNYEIHIPRDVSCDRQYYTVIYCIVDMYHFDENGVKFKIEIQ